MSVTDHRWKITEVDGPGPKFYWVCRECGSSGGPSMLPWEKLEVKVPTWKPFLAGTPLQPVSDNCAEAKKQIDDFVTKNPEWREYMEKGRGIDFPYDS